ncbi:hypothetical protein DEU56DRAFT_903953 [Suillus clintonianus]|uniref:uncharacterized protein n=1 Tax=Suillus clintonianus TaxID=1904413 RepID=UPI001B87730A|nr:uncharacterized protein DEU56DRAFT_903953 [Suillus clintonianus]KAG2124617.1 hypothetical protein DEU56DRAFT_903953 [Suillus clintonianus]
MMCCRVHPWWYIDRQDLTIQRIRHRQIKIRFASITADLPKCEGSKLFSRAESFTTLLLFGPSTIDSNIGGEIVVLKGGCGQYLINQLVAAQNFDYNMSNILDKLLGTEFGSSSNLIFRDIVLSILLGHDLSLMIVQVIWSWRGPQSMQFIPLLLHSSQSLTQNSLPTFMMSHGALTGEDAMHVSVLKPTQGGVQA